MLFKLFSLALKKSQNICKPALSPNQTPKGQRVLNSSMPLPRKQTEHKSYMLKKTWLPLDMLIERYCLIQKTAKLSL